MPGGTEFNVLDVFISAARLGECNKYTAPPSDQARVVPGRRQSIHAHSVIQSVRCKTALQACNDAPLWRRRGAQSKISNSLP
jgi:hypothetical protein